MATDLYDYADVLRRMVTGPGIGPYMESTDEQLVNNLLDGFWTARLDGFFADKTVNGTMIDPDLSADEAQIVATYAAIRMIRATIMWAETRMKAVAGPVSYETERSATLLKAILEDLNGDRQKMLTSIESGSLEFGDASSMDALSVRQYSDGSYAGWGP